VHFYGEISIATSPTTWFESRWRMIASRGVRLMVTCEVIGSSCLDTVVLVQVKSISSESFNANDSHRPQLLLNSPTYQTPLQLALESHAHLQASTAQRKEGSQGVNTISNHCTRDTHQPTNQTQHVATPNTIQPTPNVTASAPLSLLPNAQALPLCVN
jgi:hypothetical protein